MSALLDRHGDRRVGVNWQVGPADSPFLYAAIHSDFEDFENEDLASVSAALGRAPALMTMIDVSGRIEGYKEVVELAVLLLRELGGVAQDDHSSRCWTMNDVIEDERVGSRAFFLGSDARE